MKLDILIYPKLIYFIRPDMLTYSIPQNLNIPIYEYLYKCIKEDILLGNLKSDDKLPSKRALADQLKISLITIEHAYDLLLIEGYIYAIEKKGYYVEKIEVNNNLKNKNKTKPNKKQEPNVTQDKYFPYDTWSKLTRKVLTDNKSLNPTSFNGDYHLRESIAKHLYEYHKINVSPDSIIIGAGSEYLYSLLIQYFGTFKIYGLENPGHINVSRIYKLNNAKFEYINLDEYGLDVNELNKTNVSIIHISAAHHYPTGITMPLKRRLELLKWADKNNGIIIEDDYDSEFRINSRPIPPLYQLDNNNHTIYMNTFSKSLSSSFRIAYMIMPDSLIDDFKNKLGFYHNTVSTLDQMVLAKFIGEGYFERHLNRKRKKYRLLHNELVEKIESSLATYNIELLESKSGLHFILKHHFSIKDKQLDILLKNNNLPCKMLSNFYDSYKETKRIVVNYSNLDICEIDDFINKLDKIFKTL